jgi:DeoR/GlpR family transcriptional regulator of sugar metabolism
VVAKDLAAELGLSEDSIRRDLRELAAEGLCKKVYGGALPIARAEVDYANRQRVEPDSKVAVARRAAGLIQEGMTAILDGGTTTLAVARTLPHDLRATIVTHSPTIAAALVEHPGVDVYLIGGRLFKHSAVTCGAAAVEYAQGVNADIFLLGVTGVHAEAGLTTGDPDEAAMKRALAKRAADTFVLASSEKIGAVSDFVVLPLKGVTGIVTDTERENSTLRALDRMAVPLLYADAGDNRVDR